MPHSMDNIFRAVCAQPWAILPGKLDEILAFLELRSNGVDLSAAQIAERIGPRHQVPAGARGVAVLPLYGIVAHRLSAVPNISGPGATSTLEFGQAFDAAVANPNIGTIIIDVDSPGGTISGVPELAAKIFAARPRKRIIAVADTVMASAAYWIGAAAHEVVASPSALVGSIGVYTVHYDRSRADARDGIKRTVVSAGRFKAEGHDAEPLSDSARDSLQKQVSGAYTMFVRDVARFRGVTASDVMSGFGQGRALLAGESVIESLADRIGTFESVLAPFLDQRASSGGSRRGAFAQAPTSIPVARPAAPTPQTHRSTSPAVQVTVNYPRRAPNVTPIPPVPAPAGTKKPQGRNASVLRRLLDLEDER
jgi:signal peptide peptidase SppA